MDKHYYVYIVTNKPFGVFYTGVTNDLKRRIYEHKYAGIEGFTEKYNAKRLVFYETHTSVEAAIIREKRIKRWPREYKINVIQKMNPNWNDLYEEIVK